MTETHSCEFWPDLESGQLVCITCKTPLRPKESK